MAEYIEREAFKEEVRRLSTHYLNEWDTLGVLAAADRIHASDVRPVVRGKWILHKDRDSTGKFEYVQWSCSACKSNVRTGQPRFDSTLRERPRFNFCPYCGAKMEES